MAFHRSLIVLRRSAYATAIALSCVSVASGAHAQSAPTRESAIEMRARFLTDLDSLQNRFLALAEAIPAEKYSWRPAPGVRSIGEVFMHVASEYYVYAPLGYGATRSPVIPRGPEAFKTFRSEERRGGKECKTRWSPDH